MAGTIRRACSAALLVGAIGVGACGDGSDGDGACGPTTRESLDPAYLVHVLADADGLEYTSEPPTSGPHQSGPAVSGVVDEPLSRPVQVGILERGDILLQHDPELDPAAIASLEALAGERVVVAPNPDLPDPVVATAWLFKRTCDTADVDALQGFVDERVGNGPEG
jgi:hypothetical protein